MTRRTAVTILMTGVGAGWVHPASAEEVPAQPSFEVQLTHGVSHIDSPELQRLSVPSVAFVVGAGGGCRWPNGWALDAEVTVVDTTVNAPSSYGLSRAESDARTWFHQKRLTVGGSYRHALARHLVVWPEAGLSYNSVEVEVRERSFELGDHDDPRGWYLGLGGAIPFSRVSIDLRAKYQSVGLDMPRLGVDDEMSQLTVLAGLSIIL